MAELTTKERILDAAEEIMLEKSFHSVGLNQILKAVKVPKGSFYHHFESKEQFGVELLKHYVDSISAHKRRVLLSSEPEQDPRRRILTHLESTIAKLLENNGKCPCLALKLAAEVSDFSDPMRQVLADAQREWIEILAAAISEACEVKAIDGGVNPKNSATLINSLWIGAMQQSTVARNVDPLRNALSFIEQSLLPKP